MLVYTTLFPNSVQPINGNFILERIRHLVPFADISVIAPIPYFPSINLYQRWFEFAMVPHTERIAGFNVDHPRYLVLPRIGMTTHGLSMFAGSLPQVRRRLRAADYDLIDAHYIYPDGLAAIVLGTLFNKPVVVSARGSDVNVFSKFHAIRPLIRQVLARADAVVAVAQSLKDLMIGLGCPGEKITVIGNGVDPVKFKPEPRCTARQELGLPTENAIVLSVGQLLELKGFHILIDAMVGLRRLRPNLTLVIVGEGPYRPRLEKQIRNLALEENVRLVGARPHEQLSQWYSAADVFCLASSREGWANVVMEAMACGCPVIATPVGGTAEIV
ncbi:MAG: glycosyl transferase family 1, partial [Acidobacteria bacterium]